MSRFSKFLSSRAGRRLFNVAYSWGACLVILGATFKIAHYPYDDLFLTIGMVTEIVIFFLSGFEEPPREYRWEQVFPQLLAGEKPAGHPDTDAAFRHIAENIENINKAYAEEVRFLESRLARLREADACQAEMNERLRAIDEQYRRIMEVVCMTKNNQTK